MAPVPAYRLKSSPVWHYSMIDLFGPIQVRDFVNQRTSRKTWGVLITCLTTRACAAYLAGSFSTDSLLLVLKKFESRNGSPSQYFADLGTQIVGADRAMVQAVENLNKDAIENFANSNETKFTFGTAHFPEGQGAVERLVKEIKKSLRVITNNITLSFEELDSALQQASYLVNCRPLQLNPTTGDDSFICPNDILMGRSTKNPVQDGIFDNNLTKRMAHVQRIVQEFWSKWSSSYYQSLIKYHKWRLRERDAQPNDVVLILDKEISKGKFTLGIIDSVKTDSDGLIRKATVKYKLPSKGDTMELKTQPYKYAERNVRGLALIVTAEERKQSEAIDIDDFKNQEESTEDTPKHEDANRTFVNQKTTDKTLETTNNNAPKDAPPATNNKEELESTSSGRKRFKPKILDL